MRRRDYHRLLPPFFDRKDIVEAHHVFAMQYGSDHDRSRLFEAVSASASDVRYEVCRADLTDNGQAVYDRLVESWMQARASQRKAVA